MMRAFAVKAVFSILALVFLAGCGRTDRDHSDALQHRVVNAGKIRCGWFNWEPLLKKDVNSGVFSGIAVDVMDELTSRLNLTYEWAEEVGPSTAVESVKSKRVDMICIPVVITQPRMRVADFSDPILYNRFTAWVKHDLPVQDATALNHPEYKFVAIDGTAVMAMAKRLFPKADMLSLTELSPSSDLFLSVTSGKADAVYTDSSSANMFLHYNPGQIKPLYNDKTDKVLPWSFMMAVNEYGFTNMINLVLRDMQLDGTVEGIVRKRNAEKMYFLPPNPTRL